MRQGGRALALATALAVALASGFAAAGCGDDDPSAATTDATESGLHHACDDPPTTIALEGVGDQRLGSAAFHVVDAVALRVPLSTGDGSTVDTYALHLADFEIERRNLAYAAAALIPPPDGTLGILTVVPPTEAGLAVGDIVDHDARLSYETTTSPDPLALIVTSTGSSSPPAFRSFGGVEVLELDDDLLCLSMNVTFADVQGRTVSSVRGAIVAPVVDAEPAPPGG